MNYKDENQNFKLHAFPTPFTEIMKTDGSIEGAHLMVFSSINHYMYRNLNNYDNILFIDMGEVPVPCKLTHYHDNFKRSLGNLGNKDICFKSAFFYRLAPQNTIYFTARSRCDDSYNVRLNINNTSFSNSTDIC